MIRKRPAPREPKKTSLTSFAHIYDMATVLIVLVLWRILSVHGFVAAGKIYNVLDYKAVGNGRTDNTNAFLQAWAAVCADSRNPSLVIPYGRTFLLRETVFSGPCASRIHVKLQGRIVAPNSLWTNQDVNLLTFHNVNRLTVDGSGEIDGRGKVWWKCVAKQRCRNRPNNLAFLFCNDLILRSITVKNSANKQITMYKCDRVHASRLRIIAPADSPNTDGILITGCRNVSVRRSVIGTGDDCIAVGPGSSHVNVTGVKCGPGHGFSIGSLGIDGTRARVEQIRVSHCTVSQSLTGVRIKTWQGGTGYAKGIVFEHINFTSVKTPVVIDQYYCPAGNCGNKSTSVAVRDVQFINLTGFSNNDVAINLLCSKQVPCRGIVMRDVNLKWIRDDSSAKSVCYNAIGSRIHNVSPQVRCFTG